jgi:hypothetical protein
MAGNQNHFNEDKEILAVKRQVLRRFYTNPAVAKILVTYISPEQFEKFFKTDVSADGLAYSLVQSPELALLLVKRFYSDVEGVKLFLKHAASSQAILGARATMHGLYF